MAQEAVGSGESSSDADVASPKRAEDYIQTASQCYGASMFMKYITTVLLHYYVCIVASGMMCRDTFQHVVVVCSFCSRLIIIIVVVAAAFALHLLTCLLLAVFFHLLLSGKVSRKATLHHAGSIELRGKSIVEYGASIHGISSPPSSSGTGRRRKVRIGRYCYIGPNVTLRPATMPSADDDVDDDNNNTSSSNDDEPRQEMSLIVGANTSIGEGTTSRASAIGTSVVVGRGCTLGNRCVLKDCVLVEDGTVVPSDMVVPPFAVVRGDPARILDADDDVLPESAAVAIPEERVAAFGAFVSSLGG